MVIMDRKMPTIQEKGDFRELTSFLEASGLLNDFDITDSENETVDVKTILRIQNSTIEARKEIFNNSSNMISKIRQIDISCCGLINVPDIIFSMKYLTVLNLSNNFLENLPNELGNLCNLLTLKLSGNKLKSLPNSLKNIQQLNYLDLSYNQFSEVPDVLCYGLRGLMILDLSCNKIREFNDPPGCLHKLIALSLSNNFLKQLPFWVFDNLCQLKYLDISQNTFSFNPKLHHYPKTGIYESLQLLNCENCNLSFKNLGILSCLKKLKYLYIGNKKDLSEEAKGSNYLGNFESNVFMDFQEITDLHLQNVQIATLPKDFDIFKNVKILDLSDNLLSWLPECFCNLTNLEILYLTSNQLLLLPVNIGNLVNLKQIHLGNNKLNQIPESFYSLTNLEFVDLYNNEIEKIDSKIFKYKNLKGIDLGLNCISFDFCENTADVDEIQSIYNCFKDSFRRKFCYLDNRSDIQNIKIDKNTDETNSDLHSYYNQSSLSSFDSESLSDVDNLSQNLVIENYFEDDDWDSYQDDKDEYFDPNTMDLFHQPQNLWEWDHHDNYCPANYHAPSVMRTYVNNFKLAIRNECVEEGQFDSD